jgi:hypothetical protein
MLAYALALLLAQADAAPASSGSAVPSAASVAADGTPKGAPAENYDFVAWCHGALSGHMALYGEVKPELVAIEQPGEVATDEKNDKAQLAAGREYLALYTRALDGVDKGHAGNLIARRRAAEAQGSAIWDPYKAAPPRQRMWAWVGWDLPGRCETAAKKLLTPAGRIAALHSPAPAASGQPQSIDDALGGSAPAPPPADAAGPALRGPQ